MSFTSRSSCQRDNRRHGHANYSPRVCIIILGVRILHIVRRVNKVHRVHMVRRVQNT